MSKSKCGVRKAVALVRKFPGIIYQTLKNKWVLKDFPEFVLRRIMKMLWDPPTEIQASGFRTAARRIQPMPEWCLQAGVHCAAVNPAVPLPSMRGSASQIIAAGGSGGNQKQSSFFVLRKTRTRL
ncbi:MAG: hypothetical protein LC130_09285 [Bryobacterales bacterium]|nr:hypothetical protein [Bryobacterales bacterium]MEB2360113.1 hypothetical protein [Bryobacterales bacterium]